LLEEQAALQQLQAEQVRDAVASQLTGTQSCKAVLVANSRLGLQLLGL
jgi:hypothetical protein